MKNHRILIFFVVILIALTLAACERSASTPPPAEGTAAPDAESTQNPMDELGALATQTAMAQNPEGGEDTGGETPPEGGDSGNSGGDQTSGEDQTEEKPAEATPVPPKEYKVPNNYTLQKGEFPYCIARRFNISPGALLAANGLTSASVTYAGQTLTIPKNAGPFDAGARALRAHPEKYTVRAGDTVFSIACQYGDVDPRAIEDANGFSGAYTLQVGDTIQIP